VSLMMSTRRRPQEETLSRLGRVREAWRQSASGAAGRIAPAARGTREAAVGRMHAARGRSAPLLRKAGDYVESDLGPRVGGMLSDAARRVEPPQPARKSRNAAMIIVVAMMAVGLAGALLTGRGNAREAKPEMDAETGVAAATVPADADGQIRTT
jgi:hypothetical protein